MQVSYADLKKDVLRWQEKWGLAERLFLEVGENETRIVLHLEEVLPKDFLQVQIIAKRHIENWRVHSFADGFLSIQALNKNLFDTAGILQNLKIRVSSLYEEKSIDFSRKGIFEPKELSLIESCLEYFQKGKSKNPLSELNFLGCTVYPPENGFGLNFLAGYSQIKEEIEATVVFPLKHPEEYSRVSEATRLKPESIRPRGVLFSGPPGVGKTTMARAIGAEAGFVLLYIPLENIMSSYYGESSRRLAAIFDAASKLDNVIIFLDEIDGLVQSRNAQMFEATRRLLSVLLRKLEGLEERSGIIVIGATNRKEDLDPALISRFDSDILFPLPNLEDIDEILKMYAKQLSSDDRKELGLKLQKKSPRAIKYLCTLAERHRVRKNLRSNTQDLPSIKDYINVLTNNSDE